MKAFISQNESSRKLSFSGKQSFALSIPTLVAFESILKHQPIVSNLFYFPHFLIRDGSGCEIDKRILILLANKTTN